MQDWHTWRAQGIGASDAPVIMRMFPYGKTPHKLWEEKVSGEGTLKTKAMDHGNRMEPKALKWAQSQLGIEFITQQRAEHPEMPWMRATLDGIDHKNESMIEIKCPYNLSNHEAVKRSKKVPDIYFPQLQHQMKVKEMDQMYFLSYNHEDEYDSVLLEVKRDDKYIHKLVDEEYAFLQYIVNRTPPPLTDRDYERQGEEWVNVAKERLNVKTLMKQLEEKDKELYKSLIELSGGKNSSGGEFKFTKIIEKGRVDYEAAVAHYIDTLRNLCQNIELPSIDLESFRKAPIVKWRLS